MYKVTTHRMATYSSIMQSSRCPCRGTQTLLQRPVNGRVQVKIVMQGRQCSYLRNTEKTQPSTGNLSGSSVRTMKTAPGNFSRDGQRIKSSSTRRLLQLRPNPAGVSSCQAQSFSKKFITDGPGSDNETGEGKMTSVVQGRWSHIASVVSQTNSDIIQKFTQAKQKIPTMPRLRLPALPRFFLAQHPVKAQRQTQEMDTSIVDSESIVKSAKPLRKFEREELNVNREQYNLEEAMLHTFDFEEPLVFKVNKNSQSKNAVQQRVISFGKKMDEMSKKSGTQSLEDSLYVYRTLSKFASNLPAVNYRLMAIAVKDAMKSLRRSTVEGSDAPLREQHDLGAALENMYSTTAMPVDKLNALHAVANSEGVKVTKDKPETLRAKNIVKGLLSKAIMNSNKEKDLKKPKSNKPSRVISQASIDNRTKALVETLKHAKTIQSKLTRVEDLTEHVMTYPDARFLARKEGALSPLLKFLNSKDKLLLDEVRKALALLGHATPVKGRGVKILTIDGGGARGIVAIEALRILEKECGRPIHEIFDYICGVSSGSVLGFLLAVPKVSLDDCEGLFYTLTRDIFKRSTLVGTGQLVWNHAFYNTEAWTNVLRHQHHELSESLMIETSSDPSNPKIAALSTLIQPNAIKPHLFRNYNVPDGVNSHYAGSCQYKLWEALRASTAAPMYFEECRLGGSVHQDGGLLCNNPTSIAIHECKLLWPDTPIQCIVSLGTGRYVPEANPSIDSNNISSSLKDKLLHLVMSATDTEMVHKMLSDCMVPGTYYRFNPYLSEDITLDENRVEKIETLQQDARRYLRRNSLKINETVRKLNERKNLYHRCRDWAETQKIMRYK